MALSTLICPIDDLAMVATMEFRGDADVVAAGKVIGKHLHVMPVTFSCLGGHQWAVEEMQLKRIA